jgi:serine/threonine protein kinase
MHFVPTTNKLSLLFFCPNDVILSKKVAIKTLKKKFHKWSECVNLRELESLSKIPKSPFIVQLKELIREGDSQLHFVFEYMPDGNLYQLIKQCSANRTNGIYEAHADLSPQRVQSILFQVLSGLSHMHSHGFIHRYVFINTRRKSTHFPTHEHFFVTLEISNQKIY